MSDAVIVEAVRSPVGKRNGALAPVHAADLPAHVLRALADRSGIDPGSVDDVDAGLRTMRKGGGQAHATILEPVR